MVDAQTSLRHNDQGGTSSIKRMETTVKADMSGSATMVIDQHDCCVHNLRAWFMQIFKPTIVECSRVTSGFLRHIDTCRTALQRNLCFEAKLFNLMEAITET